MQGRSIVQITGISDSSILSLPLALERKNSRRDSLSKSRQHHSFQSHSSSKHNPRSNSVTVRTPRNSIWPANNRLSDYNDPLSLNIAALRHDRKTSIEPSFGQNSLLSTQSIPFYTSTLGTNQNHGSLTQFAGNTSEKNLLNKSPREQKICSLKTNNKNDIHEEYYHKKPTTNNKYFSTLTNASSNTDNSSSNSQAFNNFHGNGGKAAYKDDRESENRRRRKCCGVYCCACSSLCMFLSVLAMLLLAAGIAALLIAFLKPESVTTTVTSTTTTSVTTTTSSSTSTTTTTSVTTTTSSSTSTTTTTSVTTTTSSSTSTTSTTSTTTTETTTTTTSTSSTSSTTTTPRPMCPIPQPGDPIEGLYNTIAGGSTGGFNGVYSPYSQTPDKAIDNDLTTKYLNYGANGSMNAIQSQPGAGTGFYVTPTGNATVANGLLFATGGDYPERDPLFATLEGTNSTALNSSTSWTLIYSGPTGIDPTNNATNRSTYGTLQVFSNIIAYQSYRLLIISQRSAQDSIQYSESHIMTYC